MCPFVATPMLRPDGVLGRARSGLPPTKRAACDRDDEGNSSDANTPLVARQCTIIPWGRRAPLAPRLRAAACRVERASRRPCRGLSPRREPGFLAARHGAARAALPAGPGRGAGPAVECALRLAVAAHGGPARSLECPGDRATDRRAR